jgi:hypothetical protein
LSPWVQREPLSNRRRRHRLTVRRRRRFPVRRRRRHLRLAAAEVPQPPLLPDAAGPRAAGLARRHPLVRRRPLAGRGLLKQVGGHGGHRPPEGRPCRGSQRNGVRLLAAGQGGPLHYRREAINPLHEPGSCAFLGLHHLHRLGAQKSPRQWTEVTTRCMRPQRVRVRVTWTSAWRSMAAGAGWRACRSTAEGIPGLSGSGERQAAACRYL